MRILLLILIWPGWVWANCKILNSDGSLAGKKDDVLYQALVESRDCPTNVSFLKNLLLAANAKVQPSMVANRGRHNPELGSFSFFESVTGLANPGEFFFGHFTVAEGKEIILDQNPARGKLLIELIVWDQTKKLFNFYELIGTETGGNWFYRGDSLDALSDNAYLYREEPEGAKKFGTIMRCSACHSSGGPIMKELDFPHNDWWTAARPLTFGTNRPSQQVSQWMSELIEARQFADNVKTGIQKLESSATYQNFRQSMSLQERLRPLFCENEINLQSDISPNEAGKNEINIPGEFFLNPILGFTSLQVSRRSHANLLIANKMRFPETTRGDADHAWLTPVKGYSDLLAIQTLLNAKVIDEEFIFDILMIDFEHPLFSSERCSLLKALPKNTDGDWKLEFMRNLSNIETAAAKKASVYLAASDLSKHKEDIEKYKNELRLKADESAWFEKLLNVRQDTFKSEISQNPRGQILEPGFRVIFPEATK